MVSFLYIILAIFGLSFLIFIHELGHYWMARRVGMRVETFAIGFGRPIFSWVSKDGVKWQIGWLPFGGYVKIKGQEFENETDPYSVTDGFFGKSPIDRIKVAFMGPFVNILFAIVAFGALWLIGGREKNFSEFTSKIGWVDPKSELYAQGIRPGDEIAAYNGSAFQGSKDHMYAPMTSSTEMMIAGNKVDEASGEKSPFEAKVKVYPHPAFPVKGVLTAGILQSASYLIYDKLPGEKENPLPEGSPLTDSGIQYGDRIIWVDGEVIYSSTQLSQVLNDHRALLTIQRGDEVFLRRVPRVQIQELKLDPSVKEELTDWQFEAQLNGVKIQKLYAIPYNLTNECVVENEVHFIDKDREEEAFTAHPYSKIEDSLQPGDKILAIDGKLVNHSFELLAQLQVHAVHIIVQREPSRPQGLSWKSADKEFEKEIDRQDLQKIANSIGTASVISSLGDLHLLQPVTPKMRSEFKLTPEKQAWVTTELLEQKKKIESIEDPERRAQALHQFENQEKQLLLGLPHQDLHVLYNPEPLELFYSVFHEIWRTLTALLTGSLNVKWISGPIGIVQVVHDTSMSSIREALFWLGAISLNLGVLNLLPIPVLDGGAIVLSLFELITRKRIHPKTLEKIILPFAILLIAFFIYLTYNDLSRLLGGLWRW
jgi:regulator of sigma E protease